VKLGMVGLGRMGGNMSQRLVQRGHEVVGYDRDPTTSDVPDLAALVAALDPPRAVWVMVPSGTPTDDTVAQLRDLLEPGDVLVDGGNSNFRDSMRHGEELAAVGVGFIDAGVSGGIWGLQEGYALMVGGTPEHVALLGPAFDALAPDGGGFSHVGPNGAGHFTKMVHNGIEYGLMQAYAEGYELLAASELEIDVRGALGAWQQGSVVRSWLLDLLVLGLDADPELASVRGYASDSGEGRWTVNEAVRLAVPLPVISAALFSRFASRQDDSPAMKVVATLRNQFGGHSTEAVERRPAEAGSPDAVVLGEGSVEPS
jgi:6-phosphogluconate dehydrogenase